MAAPLRTAAGRGLLRQRAATLGSADDDTLLLAWIRHYAAPVVAVVVLTIALALAWGAFAVPNAEYWSIVVDTEQRLPAQQLGVVAEALFRAETTYKDVLSQLGIPSTQPEELYGSVELKAVPDARILIVDARANNDYDATQRADLMAHALAKSFQDAGYSGFQVLGSPQPAPVSSAISLPTLVLLGTMIGLLLGLGVAILTYQSRRPVIAMRRAAGYVLPSLVVTAPGRRRWLGALRAHTPGLSSESVDVLHAQLPPSGEPFRVVVPGVDERHRAIVARELGLADPRDASGPTVVVCDPKTREEELLRTMLGETDLDEDERILLWLE